MPVALQEFKLEIFGDITTNTQIGVLLNCMSRKRPEASPYGLFANYCYVGKSVYCAFTICLVDKDWGNEMDIAVVEISMDENTYVMPLCISEEAIDYYTYDDIANMAFWLGNFWIGIQHEMINCPEEVRVVEQRGSFSGNSEEYKKENNIVLVKRIIPVDENGKAIIYERTESGRQYHKPSWGVRGHMRTLPDGREVPVRSYRKGKERNDPDVFTKKEYKFDKDKIDSDI